MPWQGVKSSRVLKALRVLRFLKLTRLLKGTKILQRIDRDTMDSIEVRRSLKLETRVPRCRGPQVENPDLGDDSGGRLILLEEPS